MCSYINTFRLDSGANFGELQVFTHHLTLSSQYHPLPQPRHDAIYFTRHCRTTIDRAWPQVPNVLKQGVETLLATPRKYSHHFPILLHDPNNSIVLIGFSRIRKSLTWTNLFRLSLIDQCTAENSIIFQTRPISFDWPLPPPPTSPAQPANTLLESRIVMLVSLGLDSAAAST